ncbi:MAG TPA: DAK2 domain-containing protein, partial [Candidatus Limadaptatus stercoripullorum]|nr:DAK2 domain-containing protein [Candidatus Limadaptatus stercoripullorum]
MRTPEMLPVLAKAGVVDAGGRGLVTMFEGMLSALTGSEIRLLDASKTASGPVETGAEGARQYTSDVNDYENITFQYCTEYFITHMGSDVTVADIDRYRDYLCTIGDCVLVIGDLDLVKTHVHTNTPDRAIKAALKLGELDGIKIENMMEQHRKIVAEREKNEQKPVELRPYGMVSVCAGEGMDAIFRDLQTDVTIEGGQTMNPSVYDILNAVNSTKAKDVFVLPNNSNIILAAEQAKELADVTVHVIPTRNMPEGISAALAFSPEATPEENEEMMTEAFRGIMTAEITHAVRSTRMNGFSVKEGDIIGISDKKIIAKGASVQEVAVACASKLLEGGAEMITAYYGSDISESEAERMIAIVAETHPDAETATYYGGQPHYYYILAAE